ncbi:MAG TPA: hypothetical protein VG405_04460 [Solirubrobacteraceae bacterium]|nr:hypothetical protein [Solirubrobacteraceae bacterium]
MTDAPSQAARPSGEPLPQTGGGEPVPPTGDNPEAVSPGAAAAQPQATQPDGEETQPVVKDTVPAPDDVSDSSVDLSRIAWSITTAAFLTAMVVLVLRGDLGYAGVTLAVAIAAGINLF